MNASAGDQVCHAGHQEPASAAAHALDGLVSIAEAPDRRLNGNGCISEIGAQVHQRSAVFQHLQAPAQFLLAAAAENHAVHRATVVLNDLLNVVLMMIIHQMGRSIFLCHIEAYLSGTDGKNVSGALKNRRPNRHQPDRAYAKDGHGLAEFQVQRLDSLKCGTHHIRHHHRLLQRHALWNLRQIHIRIPDVILLHKGTAPVRIIDSRVHIVLPVLRMSVLRFQTAPYRHYRTDDNPVAWLKIMDLRSHLYHLAAHLMPHRLAQQVRQRRTAGGAQMSVAGAGRPDQRTDQRARGTDLFRQRTILTDSQRVRPCDDNSFHSFHAQPLLPYVLS